jgi:iron complex transport system substrate-binding protein
MTYKLFNYFLVSLICCLILNGCRTAPTTERNGTTAINVTDADGKNVEIADNSRIVSIGTAATETIYALEAGDKLIAVDNSSAEYIPQTAALPKVGSRSSLNAEGILSLKPTLVILGADSGPPQIFDQLRKSGITVLTLKSDYTTEAIKNKITTIAGALGKVENGKALIAKIETEMADVVKLLEKKTSTPKVIFVGRGPNSPNATMSGQGTTINEMIKMAGGENPFTDFTGFREMTDEAVVAAQPDIILITERSFERSGGVDGVLKFPGVALTPAGKNKRIIPVSDMYFQGFGPGVGKAVAELTAKFHPEVVK